MTYLGADVNFLAARQKAQGVHTLSPLFFSRCFQCVCVCVCVCVLGGGQGWE